MGKALEKLKQITKIQCMNGNWNYDPYMHGMANGLILAQAIMEGKTPKYLHAPIQWLSEYQFVSDNNSLKATSLPDRKSSQEVDERETP